MYTQISFFTGCGGSSTGFHQSGGFVEVLAVEIDEHSVRSFNLNYPNVPVTNLTLFQSGLKSGENENMIIGVDKNLKGSDYLGMANGMFPEFNNGNKIELKQGELDVLAASPPCQDFSTINTRKKFKPNSEKVQLFFETIRLIKEIKPRVAVIENVPGMMMGTAMKKTFLYILKALHESEYSFAFNILNATHYGVPQDRNRVIFLCVRKDVASKVLGRAGFDPNWWPVPLEIDRESLALKRVVPRASYYSSGEFQDKILPADRVVGTITKTPSMSFYDEKFERLEPTIREVKLLCGFPEGYLLYDNSHQGRTNPEDGNRPYTDPATGKEYNYTEKHYRLGNAVPPPMMRAIAQSIKEKILAPYYSITE